MSDPYNRDRQTALWKIILGLIVIFALLSYLVKTVQAEPSEVGFYWTDSREVYEVKINRFLDLYFARCNPAKLDKARKVVPVLLDVAERENVNPSIVAAIITHESTWSNGARGRLGEIGLMQVNNVPLSDDPHEQISTGVTMLKGAYERCGTVAGAISLYARGHGCKPYKGAALRMAVARRIEAL